MPRKPPRPPSLQDILNAKPEPVEEESPAGRAAAAHVAVKAQLQAMDVVRKEIKAFAREKIKAHAQLDEQGNVIWSESLIQQMGTDALFSLWWLSEAGDKDAAKYLADRALGAPEQPFTVKLASANLSKNELLLELYMEYRRKGLTDEKARANILEEVGEEVPALPEFTGEG